MKQIDAPRVKAQRNNAVGVSTTRHNRLNIKSLHASLKDRIPYREKTPDVKQNRIIIGK
jgi:hypothetical protein